MAELLKWFSDIADKITGWLNLGENGTVAVGIGILILGIVIASAVFRIVKKAVGKTIATIVLIAILITSGFISTTQIASFAEKIGVITQSSVGEGLEVNGQAFVDWIEGKKPDSSDDEEIGSWVPKKEEQKAEDWTIE